uniref:Uncharacterized protein n=1 Tax=Romanomermis culicivorax TaxID=13658 RepID=A0A915KBY6_ROMCU
MPPFSPPMLGKSDMFDMSGTIWGPDADQGVLPAISMSTFNAEPFMRAGSERCGSRFDGNREIEKACQGRTIIKDESIVM